MTERIALNTKITFGRTGTIKQFEPFGLELGEAGQSWTLDESAGFNGILSGITPDVDVAMKVMCIPYLCEERIKTQQVFVYVNGLFVGFKNVVTPSEFALTLPRAAISTRSSRITFVLPNAASPKALGIGSDIRKLGIAVSEITFIKAK